MSVSASQVASYLLDKADEEAGDLISNLKLQKLLYYCQGFHLAIFDKPLFDEKIIAWQHGPVVKSVYEEFSNNGRNPITTFTPIDPHKISKGSRELIDEVYDVYGQFSAWKLRDMTHEEAPWKDTSLMHEVITHAALKEFFVTRIQN